MSTIPPQSSSEPSQTVSAAAVQKFRKNADAYVGRQDQMCIEVGSFDHNIESYCDEVVVPVEKTRDWLDPTSSYRPATNRNMPPRVLRLMICPFNINMNAYLPVTKQSLEATLSLIGVDEYYLHSEQLQGPPNWFELQLPSPVEGFVMKVEKWDSQYAGFSLFSATDPSKRVTCAIVHILVKQNLERFKTRLAELKQVAWSPMLLPALFIEVRIEDLASRLAQVRTEVYEIEKRIGTHKNYQRLPTHTEWGFYARGEEVWNREGFEASAGELTSLAADCHLFESTCQINLKMLEWINGMERGHPSGNCGPSNLSSGKTDLTTKIAFLRNGLENNLIKAMYLGKRAEVQVQACLSIMSQRDNAVNLRISKAAIDTSKAAARDSTDMRTIGAVTLVFLPGTFTATLFSTGFFNFQRDDQVVSGWIWLYCVITAGLTALVFGGWVLWSRRNLSDSPKSST